MTGQSKLKVNRQVAGRREKQIGGLETRTYKNIFQKYHVQQSCIRLARNLRYNFENIETTFNAQRMTKRSIHTEV